MSGIWLTTLGREFDYVLDQLDRALRICPERLWERSLWEVKREHPGAWPVRRANKKAFPAESVQRTLLPIHSAFWNVAYHALFHIEFYLAGAKLPFEPPPPFREAEHRGNVVPDRTYTRAELLAYSAHNRAQAHTTLAALTDVDLERVIHRTGQPFLELLFWNVLHATEHATQLNLFLSQQSVEPPGGIAAEQRRQTLRHAIRGRTDAEIDTFAKTFGGYDRVLANQVARLSEGLAGREPAVVAFDLGHRYLVRAGGAPEDAPVDATITMSPQDFLRWRIRDLDFREAARTGRIRVDGDHEAVRRVVARRAPGS
jgi:hypothetical protein